MWWEYKWLLCGVTSLIASGSLQDSPSALEASVFSRRQRKLLERGLADLVLIWWSGKGRQASHGEWKSHQILHGQMYEPTYNAWKSDRNSCISAHKDPRSQSYDFSSSHVQMWELDHKEGWAWKKWCCLTVVLGKSPESPLDSKEINPVNPKENQPGLFTGRTDAEAEAPILWPPDVKSRLIGKDLDAGKDWGQEEKGVTEDETVGWHHQLGGNEFEQTQGDSEGGSLECCSPWGHKKLDTT